MALKVCHAQLHIYMCITYVIHKELASVLLSTLQGRNQSKVPKRKCTQEMKDILNNGEWLTDEHVVLSQELLRNQFPHIDGLQSPLLAENDGFSPVANEAIQTHHVNGDHWGTPLALAKKWQCMTASSLEVI